MQHHSLLARELLLQSRFFKTEAPKQGAFFMAFYILSLISKPVTKALLISGFTLP
jgi:hypothetical protein